MPRIYVQFSGLEQIGTGCAKIASSVDMIEKEFRNTANNLDWDIRCASDIGNMAKKISGKLKQQEKTLRAYQKFINDAYNEYENLDKYKKTNYSGASMATSLAYLMPAAKGKNFAQSVTNNGEGQNQKANNYNKVTIGNGDELKDIGKEIKDTVVDSYRKNHKKDGVKEECERSIYSSVDSGTVSILGVDFRYDKYVDYIKGSIETVDGDGFYTADAEIAKDGQHINFEATDGSGLSGDITLNGLKLYGDGELDLAKGNAYINAGADYTVVSATIGSETNLGGFSLTGEVGAGAHLDAGIHDGKITVDVGAALGVGAGVKFEINYEEIWKATCDAFSF